MALSRKVGFFEGLRYKGGGPMIAWILHRISGVGMVLFVEFACGCFFLYTTNWQRPGDYDQHPLSIALFPAFCLFLCALSWTKRHADHHPGFMAPYDYLPT